MPPNIAHGKLLSDLNLDNLVLINQEESNTQDNLEEQSTSGVKLDTTLPPSDENDDQDPRRRESVVAQTDSPTLSTVLLLLQVLLLVLFFVGTTTATNYSHEEYVIFRDIMVMLLLGFGFLMTFLRKYGLGAVGLTMLLTAMSIQLNLFVEPMMRAIYSEQGQDFPIPLSMSSLINGEFSAAALLISYGAVIGRASPMQLVIMGIVQSFVYALNKVWIVAAWWEAEDVGGTITIHMFGAYFGMAVSYVLGAPTNAKCCSSSSVSDVISLIGTTLLWVYWPSFVGATETANPVTENLCIIHTVLALLGSTVASFYLSQRLNGGKLDPVHIANSTLAGGVAVGASARLAMSPGGALTVGLLAGITSVLGYSYTSPWLERKASLYDTCGVHNLHGLPSILGGLASIIFVAVDSDADFLGDNKSVGKLCLAQIMSIILTLFVAIVSGYLTGMLMKWAPKACSKRGRGDERPQDYDDSMYWHSDYFTVDNIPEEA
jgi:ammonium transporter Rh